MAAPRVFDRDLLHEWMFSKTDAKGMLALPAAEVAYLLGQTAGDMSRLMGELVREGRLVRHGKTSHTKFEVIDPALWRWEHPQTVGIVSRKSRKSGIRDTVWRTSGRVGSKNTRRVRTA